MGFYRHRPLTGPTIETVVPAPELCQVGVPHYPYPGTDTIVCLYCQLPLYGPGDYGWWVLRDPDMYIIEGL